MIQSILRLFERLVAPKPLMSDDEREAAIAEHLRMAEFYDRSAWEAIDRGYGAAGATCGELAQSERDAAAILRQGVRR